MSFSQEQSAYFKKLLKELKTNQASFVLDVCIGNDAGGRTDNGSDNEVRQLSAAVLSGVLNGSRRLPEHWIDPIKQAFKRLIEGKFADNAVATDECLKFLQAIFPDERHTESPITDPGEPLPFNSPIYITRDCDDRASRCVDQDASLVWISGAPKTGVSSLLNQIEAKASKKGRVLRVNASADVKNRYGLKGKVKGEVKSGFKLMAFLLEEILEQLQLNKEVFRQRLEEIGFSSSEYAMKKIFQSELEVVANLQKHQEPVQPLYILIDDFDKLIYRGDISEADFNQFVIILNDIFKELPFIYIFCVVPPLTRFLDAITSRVLSQGNHVPIEGFKFLEMERLYETLRNISAVNTLGPDHELVLNYSGGNPFLIHSLLVMQSNEGAQYLNIRDAWLAFKEEEKNIQVFKETINYLIKNTLTNVSFSDLCTTPEDIRLNVKEINILQAYGMLTLGQVPDFIKKLLG